MNWLTNTYSKYAPTKVGDTVKEQALLAKSQREAYDNAGQQFKVGSGMFDKMSGYGTHQDLIDMAQKDYDNEVEDYVNQGNLEDMVGKADTMMKDYNNKYHLKDVVKDAALHQSVMDRLEKMEEDGNPSSWTNFYKNETAYLNKEGYTINEDTGEIEYNPYKAVNPVKYVDKTKAIADKIKDFKAEGLTIQYDDFGNPIGFKAEKTITLPGYHTIEQGEIVPESVVRSVASSLVASEPHIRDSVREEARMAVMRRKMQEGEFTFEDTLDFVTKNINRYANEDTRKEQIEKAKKEVEKELKSRELVAIEDGKVFDEEDALMDIAKQAEFGNIQYTLADQIGEIYGYKKSKLEFIKNNLPDTNTTNGAYTGAGSSKVNIFNVGSSNTLTDFVNPVERHSELTQRRAQLIKDANALKVQEKSVKGSVPKSEITKYEKAIAEVERKLNRNKEIVETNSETIFNEVIEGNGKSVGSLIGNSYTVVKDRQSLMGSEEEIDNPYKIYKETITSNILNQQKEAKSRTGLSKLLNGDDTEHVQLFKQLAKELYPDYEGELTEGIINDVIDHQIAKIANDQQADLIFLQTYALGLSDKIEDYKESNPTTKFHEDYPIFDIDSTGITNAKKEPIVKDFESTMNIIKNGLELDGSNFNTFNGFTYPEYFEEWKAVAEKDGGKIDIYKDDAVVRPYLSLINGEMAVNVAVPFKKTNSDGSTEEGIENIKVLLNAENANAKEMKLQIKNTVNNIQSTVLQNADNMDENQKRYLMGSVQLANMIDGTTQEWQEKNMESLEEGTKIRLSLGKEDFNFIAYKLTPSSPNKMLVTSKTKPMYDRHGMLITEPKKEEEGVLGFLNEHIDENGEPKINPVTKTPYKPRYYRMSNDAGTAVNFDDEGEVVFSSWFTPFSAENSENLRDRLTYQQAIDRGTMNKNATAYIAPDYNGYINTNTNEVTINERITNKINNGYEDYVPFTDIVPASRISTNVQLPMSNLNNEGLNAARYLFNNFLSIQKDGILHKAIITGGSRDHNHIVEDSAKGSYHNLDKGVAFDVLRSPAIAPLIDIISKYDNGTGVFDAERIPELKRLGIRKVVTVDKNGIPYKNHIHISLQDKFIKQPN